MYIDIRLRKIRIRIIRCPKKKEVLLQSILCNLLLQHFPLRAFAKHIPAGFHASLLQKLHCFNRNGIRLLLRQSSDRQNPYAIIRIRKSSRFLRPRTDLVHIQYIVKNLRAIRTFRIYLHKLSSHLFPDWEKRIILQIAILIQFSGISGSLIINMYERRLLLRLHMIRYIVRGSAFQESNRKIIRLIQPYRSIRQRAPQDFVNANLSAPPHLPVRPKHIRRKLNACPPA